MPGGIAEMENWLRTKRSEEQDNPEIRRAGFFFGVSQGAPLSPLLSTFMLIPHLLMSDTQSIVQYADDGIIYNYDADPKLEFPIETHITIHPTKSRTIKQSGCWQHPLKFLGMTYVPPFFHSEKLTPANNIKGGVLVNSTRQRKPFILQEIDLVNKACMYDLKETSFLNSKYHHTFEDFFKTKYFGFLQSRIYAGTINLDEVIQEFSYHFENWSWADMENRRPTIRRLNGVTEDVQLDIFNSSSFACLSLAKRIKHSLKSNIPYTWDRQSIYVDGTIT